MYLFAFREKGGEVEKEGEEHRSEKHQPVTSCMHLDRGPNLQPRHMPQLGIKPAMFCFAGDAQPTEPHQSGLM